MKSNQQVKPVINVESGTVTFEVRGFAPLTLDMERLHPEIVKRAALVGMAQVRIVDAAAIGMEDDDGNIMPEADRIALKRDRMAALIEHYHSGTSEWSRKGTGEGGGRSITVEAIARVKGVDYDTAKSMVARHAEAVCGGDTKKALANLRQAAKVLEAIAAIRAERTPKPKADADALLEEIS